jgi:hypothetical protein
MPRRTRVAITILIISSLSGPAFTNAFGSSALPNHVRASSSERMLPFNTDGLAAPSKRLLKSKHMQVPNMAEQSRRARSVTSSPLTSPTNGASDSPACIPAELC